MELEPTSASHRRLIPTTPRPSPDGYQRTDYTPPAREKPTGDPLEQTVKLEREISQVQTKYKDAGKLLENEAIQEFIGAAEPEILAHFQLIVNTATIEEIASQSGDDLVEAAE